MKICCRCGHIFTDKAERCELCGADIYPCTHLSNPMPSARYFAIGFAVSIPLLLVSREIQKTGAYLPALALAIFAIVWTAVYFNRGMEFDKLNHTPYEYHVWTPEIKPIISDKVMELIDRTESTHDLEYTIKEDDPWWDDVDIDALAAELTELSDDTAKFWYAFSEPCCVSVSNRIVGLKYCDWQQTTEHSMPYEDRTEEWSLVRNIQLFTPIVDVAVFFNGAFQVLSVLISI